MAKGVNKAILVGSIGQDPEVKYTQSGACVTNISVATNSSYTDKATGQKVENVEWHRVVFFNRLAEIAGEYLRKGSQVYVEGSLRTRKWQDQGGQDRYTTEIVASEMQMLGGGQGNNGGGYGQGGRKQTQLQQGYGQQQAQRPAQQTAGYTANQRPAPQQSAPAPDIDDYSDDMPFS